MVTKMGKLWIIALVFCIILLSIIIFNYTIGKEEYKNVVGISIAFEDNTTENEVRSILDNYNLTLPYELKYNINYVHPVFYSILSDDAFEIVTNNLNTEYVNLRKTSKKRNGQFVVFIDSILSDDEVISITESHNISLKKFVWVDIYYKGSAISYDDGIILVDNLEKNDGIIFANLITRKP